MYGHESQPSRIYSYEVKEVTRGGPEIVAQVRMAHRYKNELIAIDLRRRAAVEATLAALAPDAARLGAEYDGLVARKDEVYRGIERRRQQARSRLPASDEERAELARVRNELARVGPLLRRARKESFARPEVKAALAPSTEAATRERKAAYAAIGREGLGWGTRLLVDAAMRDVGRGAPPEFRRWPAARHAAGVAAATGEPFEAAIGAFPDAMQAPEGAIAVQLQGGLSWPAALAGDDTRLRIVPVPGTGLATAWLRIGSGPRREPVWAEVVFHLHRRPPEDAAVKWAYLHRAACGHRVRWSLQLVLARDAWTIADAAGSGAVGLDINWRLFPRGLRVATAIGDDGAREELWLDARWLDRWSKADSLRSIRGREFDRIRDRFAGWLAARDDLPAWLAAATAHLPAWRSQERLAAVAWTWKDRRFGGEDEMLMYALLEFWRARVFRHLLDWEANQRRKAVAARDQVYRTFLARLRRRYRTVRLEDVDWKEIKALPAPDAEDDAPAARHYSKVAAPGRLAALAREMFAAWVEVPAGYTTRRCHLCGHVGAFDAATELVHTCTHCGATWDQDNNAARNLLAGAGGDGPGAGAVGDDEAA